VWRTDGATRRRFHIAGVRAPTSRVVLLFSDPSARHGAGSLIGFRCFGGVLAFNAEPHGWKLRLRNDRASIRAGWVSQACRMSSGPQAVVGPLRMSMMQHGAG